MDFIFFCKRPQFLQMTHKKEYVFLTFSEAIPLDRALSLSNSINFEFILFVHKMHRTTSNIDFILMYLLTAAFDVINYKTVLCPM